MEALRGRLGSVAQTAGSDEETSVTRRTRVAAYMLYAVSAGAFFMGIVYLFSPTIMPYHERFLETSHADLPPKVAALFLGLMRVAGGGFLALGATLAIITRGPFMRGEAWSRGAVLIMGGLSLPPVLYVTLSIGLYTPWWLVSAMLVLVGAALLLTRRSD